jgi:hypothetical protein
MAIVPFVSDVSCDGIAEEDKLYSIVGSPSPPEKWQGMFFVDLLIATSADHAFDSLNAPGFPYFMQRVLRKIA